MDDQIFLSDSAVSEMLKARPENVADGLVRIRVYPENPLHSKYELEWVEREALGPGESVIPCSGIGILLDERGAQILNGARIDYKQGLMAEGFSFEPRDPSQTFSDNRGGDLLRCLAEHVRPVLAYHAGSVELLDLREGVAYVRFSGTCNGCGLAPMTLESVVKAAFQEHCPYVKDVVDATEHMYVGEAPE